MVVRTFACALVILGIAACATQRTENLQSLSGLELYTRLCSSCHGPNAEGDGPVAPALKTHVPDLTRLAARDGGEFPTEDVRRIIDGRNDRRAHGPRTMPVWGWQLYDISNADDASERARTDSMIDRLVNYLQSIQKS